MEEQYRGEKYLICFVLSMLVLIACVSITIGIDKQLGKSAKSAFDTSQTETENRRTGYVGAIYASSKQRVVLYDLLEKEESMDERSYEVLCRIVQAEAGCEDMVGKILVANVVLNRVADDRFPDTVADVVFQYSGSTAQFSPVASGSFYRVSITDETREAVDRALAGEDYSEGALYFAARKYAGSEKMRWFDEHLTRLFAHGGHEFFL